MSTEDEAQRKAHWTWVEAMQARFPAMLENARDFGIDRGWWPLVEELCEQMRVEAAERKEAEPRILQIKEKFGQLRVYIHGPSGDGRYLAVVSFAERLSARICEKCGAPGRLLVDRNAFWHTACDLHARPGAITHEAWEAARTTARIVSGG